MNEYLKLIFYRNLPTSVTSTLDANKYKLLMRIPLEDIEIIKSGYYTNYMYEKINETWQFYFS